MLLVIDQKTGHIQYREQVLYLYQDAKLIQKIALKSLTQVVIYGNPSIESRVWRALAEKGIPAIIISQRGKQQAAHLGSGLAVQLPMRRLQFYCAESKTISVQIARWFLVQKLLAYHQPLALLKAPEFKIQIQQSIQKLHLADKIESFLGIEGSLAKAWFQTITNHINAEWNFNGRNRRPPQDPINALLSLTYTLAFSDIRQVLLCEGLDPAFGFLHQPEAGREALVLDMLEPFRASIDAFVLTLIKQLKPRHFYYRKEQGCRLSKEARPIYFKAWAVFKQNFNQNENNPKTFQTKIRAKTQQLRQIMKWCQNV